MSYFILRKNQLNKDIVINNNTKKSNCCPKCINESNLMLSSILQIAVTFAWMDDIIERGCRPCMQGMGISSRQGEEAYSLYNHPSVCKLFPKSMSILGRLQIYFILRLMLLIFESMLIIFVGSSDDHQVMVTKPLKCW